jgi:hypothetical protein
MATAPGIAASTIALNLDGALPTLVTSVALPALTFPASGVPGLSTFEGRFDITGTSTLLDWVMSIARQKNISAAGSVLVANQNFDIQRRVDWRTGQVVAFALDALDATAGKKSWGVTFSWHTADVKFSRGAGKLTPLPGGKSKLWSVANFRVVGLPLPAAHVQGVELPTVSLTANGLELGPLRVTVVAAATATALEWALKLRDNGGVASADHVDITVDMLDATLSKTLGTITLSRCALVSFAESRLERTGQAIHKALLTFAVAGLDLQVPA